MPVKKKVLKKKVVKKVLKRSKRVARKTTKKTVKKEIKKNLVGEISHYYSKIKVGILEVKDNLAVGDNISIEGSSTNLSQKVDSMQIEHEPVKVAKSGDSIGMKVKGRVREGDKVYKLA